MVEDAIPQVGTDEQEVWRAIPSLPGYEASSLGRIRSVDRLIERAPGVHGRVTVIHHEGRILKLRVEHPKKNLHYLVFTAYHSTISRVNRVVCETFNGPPPSSKHDAAHIDGNEANNQPGNLRWSTRLENIADKVTHGTQPRGSRIWRSIVTEEKVPEMFLAYFQGQTVDEIAERVGVKRAQIQLILGRRKWLHVEVNPEHVAFYKATAKEIGMQNLKLGPAARRKPT